MNYIKYPDTLTVSQLLKTFRCLKEPDGSLLCSQVLTTCPDPVPD